MKTEKLNLFKKFKELVRKYPVADISHHKDEVDKKYPVADISHHHSKDATKTKDIPLNESMASWKADGDPYDSKDGQNDENNMHVHLPSLEKEHVKSLSTTHHVAVNAYVEGGLAAGDETGSRRVNMHLIDAHKNGKDPDKHFDFGDEEGNHVTTLHIDHLDDAIKQNKLNHKLTTYSGITFNPSHLMDERNIVHLPAYTSSSTNRGAALGYTMDGKTGSERHVLQITHPKGSTGLYMGNNEDLSPFGQSEHLSPRNMKISINPEPELHSCPSGHTLHIWHAKRLTK